MNLTQSLCFACHLVLKVDGLSLIANLFLISVCKDPPYKVEESGYAGFILPIEVYFKNKVHLTVSATSRPSIMLFEF